MEIRAARECDLEAILEIYNHAVIHSTATFDVVRRSPEAQQEWFAEHIPPYPVVVCEEGGCILGWGSISPYAPRPAYRFAGEVSVYVRSDARRRGVGKALLRELMSLGATNGLHTLVALITQENEASCLLAEKTGFYRTGTLEEVGFKFDRWLDVAVFQFKCAASPDS